MNRSLTDFIEKRNFVISGLAAGLVKYGVYFSFLLMIIFFSTQNPRFLSLNNGLLILQQASPLGIVAVGMTFVLITAGIDISVGRIMFFSGSIISYLLSMTTLLPPSMFEHPGGYLIAFMVCIIAGALVGVVNGVLIAKLRIVPFICTLAIGSVIRALGLIISDSRTLSANAISSFVNGSLAGIPIALIFFISIAIIFDHILRNTVYGKQLMAIGNSPEMARKTGINVDRNIIVAYILCGALSGIAGALLAGQIGVVAIGFGEGNEFIVISAAVLGGTSLFGGKGSIIPGAIIGIILVTTIMNGLAMVNASPYVYTITRGLIIFFAVMIDCVKYKGELR